MTTWGNKRAPNGRPLSTLARSFSDSLDNAFLMSPEIESLSQSVAQKKEAVTSQQSELEQLEAKIRETEARLREKALAAGIQEDLGEKVGAQRKTANKRAPLDDVFTPPPAPAAEAEKQTSGTRRPQTGHGRKQSSAGSAKRK